MILLSRGTLATQADEEGFRELMVQAGRIDDLPERLIDAASALTGCGPAFAFVFCRPWPTAPLPAVCPWPKPGNIPPRCSWAAPGWLWTPRRTRKS